ncbi:hypothetical protein [Desulfuromonas thiophila]|jgi:hypothetical protein|uniref:Lipoprotein n=1 Tax=Desulfuromonas thiophila TaxID=57664 RepID=A0A1G6Z6X4_9BACT|nr:hypothetical protein [Desulfuromonas thiophila]MCK9172844.1 hypothetical protein [Desulfuromonas thiophila]MDD3802725.1 hypothetical protein [Desulfuromonas thiophila]MDY0398978.1 hypothetical protein [Desulfuromonas thiophila]SDD97576.1 hypothetical protein SAMN05661003_102295 [Desulfuromonas thiophila]
MTTRSFALSLFALPLLTLIMARPGLTADTELAAELQQSPAGQQGFEQTEPVDPPGRRGNILNIVLDRTPSLSTQRGTLVIEAFADHNDNSVQDADEPLLRDGVFCTVDDIRYQLPAFIPGLDYNARYAIRCEGTEGYAPTLSDKNVLIARRGEIIRLSIPCHPLEP